MRVVINKCCNKLWCPGPQTVLNICSLVAPRGPAKICDAEPAAEQETAPVLKHRKYGIGRVKTFNPPGRVTQNIQVFAESSAERDTLQVALLLPLGCAPCVQPRERRAGTNQPLILLGADTTKEPAPGKATPTGNCSQAGDCNMTILNTRIHP